MGERSCCGLFRRDCDQSRVPIDLLAIGLSGELEMLQPRLRNADVPPAIDGCHRGMKHRCDAGQPAQLLERVIRKPLHKRHTAIFAVELQAKVCDNRARLTREIAIDDLVDGDQLQRLKAEHGDSTVGLATLLGISADKVSKVLKGKRRLTVEEADTLRTYYGLKAKEPGDAPRQLPIVGLVAAGTWREGFEEIRGYMPSPDPSLGRDAFVVIIEGESMNKVARNGEAIIVDPRERHLISGKFYVVRNAHGETTFKQYRDNPARLEPVSDDEGHQTIYPGQDGFEVIGRAVKRVQDL